ncbi:MAG: hypothetical protein HY301_14515 [Verrucomicrobia bacterium]|nr:hypothetical protein [Verrucomicrobiota bacterium]
MAANLDLGPNIQEDDPIRKFILLVLWQVQEDRATELVIGVTSAPESGAPITYKVDGVWYEMTPFPLNLRPKIVAELERMAKLSTDEKYPKDGVLAEKVAGIWLMWRLVVKEPNAECVLTPVQHGD